MQVVLAEAARTTLCMLLTAVLVTLWWCAADCRLLRMDELLKVKDDEALDLKEQLNRLRDDFDELRGQYATLTAQGGSKEQQREMGVSAGHDVPGSNSCWMIGVHGQGGKLVGQGG